MGGPARARRYCASPAPRGTPAILPRSLPAGGRVHRSPPRLAPDWLDPDVRARAGRGCSGADPHLAARPHGGVRRQRGGPIGLDPMIRFPHLLRGVILHEPRLAAAPAHSGRQDRERTAHSAASGSRRGHPRLAGPGHSRPRLARREGWAGDPPLVHAARPPPLGGLFV